MQILLLLWSNNFFIIWIIDAICGTIYYDAWSPRFDLEKVDVIFFNITPTYKEFGELELNYEMQFYIRAWRFSRISSIEKLNYQLTTLYDGFLLGESNIPSFRPLVQGSNKTCVVNFTQNLLNFPLEYITWSNLQNDLRQESILMQIKIEGQVRSNLFWCLKKVKTHVCNVSLRSTNMYVERQLLNLTCNGL